jgi:hypothetical protein
MKKLAFIVVFAFTSNLLFGQNMMPLTAPPQSPDASAREDEQEEKEKFVIYSNWLDNAVELSGKRYLKVGHTFYRLDSVNVGGINKLAKISLARFDGEISYLVASSKHIYFFEQNGNGTLWRYDGKEMRTSSVSKNNCQFQTLTSDDKNVIVTLLCDGKTEVETYSKAFFESKN